MGVSIMIFRGVSIITHNQKNLTRTDGKVNIEMETTKIRVIIGLLTMILKLFMNLVNVLDRN
jgi:hypothetical protein